MIYDLPMYFSEEEVKKIQEIIFLDKCKTETTSGESGLSSKEAELKRLKHNYQRNLKKGGKRWKFAKRE